MHKWLNTTLGGTLLTTEAVVVNSEAQKHLGDNLLVLGDPNFMQAVDGSPIANKFLAHCNDYSDLHPSCFSRYDKLSFESDSMALIYAAHVLGRLSNPHETLLEISRVLSPEGIVIITEFNPLSTWGIRRLCTKFNKVTPWNHEFLKMNRVLDWLQLLGFEILDFRSFFKRPPVNNNKILERLKILEQFSILPSAVYMIVAKKRVIPITPVINKATAKSPKTINAAVLARASNFKIN